MSFQHQQIIWCEFLWHSTRHDQCILFGFYWLKGKKMQIHVVFLFGLEKEVNHRTASQALNSLSFIVHPDTDAPGHGFRYDKMEMVSLVFWSETHKLYHPMESNRNKFKSSVELVSMIAIKFEYVHSPGNSSCQQRSKANDTPIFILSCVRVSIEYHWIYAPPPSFWMNR